MWLTNDPSEKDNPKFKIPRKEFEKLYKKKQRLIAKYKSENGGQSITTELKKLRTPWLKAWIESQEAYEKFLKRYKTYPLISKNDNFLDYLKSRLK